MKVRNLKAYPWSVVIDILDLEKQLRVLTWN